MSDQTMQILVVENDPDAAERFRQMLNGEGLHAFELTHAARLRQARQHIASGRTDLILLDLNLRDASGLDAIRQIRFAAPYVPIVVVTSAADQNLAMLALGEGAQDFLSKEELNGRVLQRSIRFAVEHQRLRATTHDPSLLDGLTRLLNRRGFQSLGEHYVRLARFTDNDFVVFYVDVDGLQEINNSLGLIPGDAVLNETASLLRDSFRQSDVIARIGGDEFAVLMIDAPAEAIHIVRPRLTGILVGLNSRPRRPYTLSLSMGVATCGASQTVSLEDMLAQAEKQMDEAKNRKNAYASV